MKHIENYVCTLEQAKELKRLGVAQDGIFYWGESRTADGDLAIALFFQDKPVHVLFEGDSCDVRGMDKYAAFTNQELQELIMKPLVCESGAQTRADFLIRWLSLELNKQE